MTFEPVKKKTTIRGPKGRALQVEETAGIKDENKYSIMEVHEFSNQGEYGMIQDLRCGQVSVGHTGCQIP